MTEYEYELEIGDATLRSNSLDLISLVLMDCEMLEPLTADEYENFTGEEPDANGEYGNFPKENLDMFAKEALLDLSDSWRDDMVIAGGDRQVQGENEGLHRCAQELDDLVEGLWKEL